jgi:hypothetical protein
LGVNPEPLIAPKRAGRGLAKYAAYHWTVDLVPFLPPWYTGYELLEMSASRKLPWNAHIDAAKYAAMRRREIERNAQTAMQPSSNP